jgi:hypothetical protein
MGERMADYPYDEYLARCGARLREAPTEEASRRFQFFCTASGAAEIRPRPHAGLTVLAEPSPIRERPVRRKLETIQRGLLQVPGFVPVPPDSFHLTLANLISGPDYEEAGPACIAEIRQALAGVFEGRRFGDDRPVIGRLRGAVTLSGCVVVAVDFSEADYGQIVELRQAIYAALEGTMPAREHPFFGHVTLGYLASPAREELEAALPLYRDLDGWTFTVRGAGLYTFHDMTAFCPVGPRFFGRSPGEPPFRRNQDEDELS